jgi:hypothetical protein
MENDLAKFRVRSRKKKKKSRKSPVRVLNSDPSRFQREVVPVEVTTHEKCISG